MFGGSAEESDSGQAGARRGGGSRRRSPWCRLSDPRGAPKTLTFSFFDLMLIQAGLAVHTCPFSAAFRIPVGTQQEAVRRVGLRAPRRRFGAPQGHLMKRTKAAEFFKKCADDLLLQSPEKPTPPP